MTINVKDFNGINQVYYIQAINSEEEVSINFPLTSFGNASSRIELINDLRDVSFLCEKTAEFISVMSSNIVTRDKYYSDFRIICKPVHVNQLIEILKYSCSMLGYDETNDDERIEFMENSFEYEENLSDHFFTFPELINDYWANLINGAYWEIAGEYDSKEEFFRSTYKKYPEHRFGFWESAKRKEFNFSLYFSTESWIVPEHIDVMTALKYYSLPYSNFEINDAERIEYNDEVILLTNNTAVYFNQFKQLENALICSQKVLAKKFETTTQSFASDNQQNNSKEKSGTLYSRKKRNKFSINLEQLSYKVSEIGDLVIIKCDGFNHFFFRNACLAFEDIKQLNTFLYPAYSKTQNIIEKSISKNCNWEELNDSSFEELCYDLLYCHPKFDSSTIKKMGRSKSRDGGRDILIKSKKTPTSESQLYIFQCKFLSESTSLSAAKISNAANVIMQYDAKGYGVFTSTIIDATLYDMLDGFNRSFKIDTSDTWSKYELERYLNRHEHIKNKYFKKQIKH